MKALLVAIQFLTIIPLPARFQPDTGDLARSVAFFPVVGLLMGLIIASADVALRFLFPNAVASALLVLLLIACSGALHLDGLADTADAFFSSRPKERMLEIMHDSRSGPMGIIAVAGVTALKMVSTASLPESSRWSLVLLMPTAGRCALTMVMGISSYARSEGGLGSAFQAGGTRMRALGAAVVLAGAGWLSAG